jgi:hypothetical protein
MEIAPSRLDAAPGKPGTAATQAKGKERCSP